MKRAIFFVTCLSLLNADSVLNNHTMERRVCDLEDRYSEHIDRITPNASPVMERDWAFYVTSNFIYWTLRLSDFSYAQSGNGWDRVAGTVTDSSKGRNHHIGWDTQPGFKVGIGSNIGYDGWDTSLTYTYFRTRNSTSTIASNLVLFFDFPRFQSEAATSSEVTKASARFKHEFNVFDYELGRNYFISKRLALRPFIGVKGTWFEEKTKLKNTQEDSEGVIYYGNQLLKADSWGIGLRPGLKSAYYLSDNFSIIGDFALSALWSQFCLTNTSSVITQTSGTLFANQSSDFHAMRPVIELKGGLKFEDGYFDDQFFITIQVAWETQIWINNSYMMNNNGRDFVYDLGTQGLTATLRFDF